MKVDNKVTIDCNLFQHAVRPAVAQHDSLLLILQVEMHRDVEATALRRLKS